MTISPSAIIPGLSRIMESRSERSIDIVEKKMLSRTIVAILNGIKSENIIPILQQIPSRIRNKVQEITLDLAGNMGLIAKNASLMLFK